ncbi:MAG: DUF4185 domain-containing protein [Kiritimatiellaeota bacterium]|nr:DUF4185 domain-containing protein [Kiritimatiellota bacterium]
MKGELKRCCWRNLVGALLALCAAQAAEPPYPASLVLAGIAWYWETLATAAPGSELWPVAEGRDGKLYAAWGDGGGFGGTDRDGRVSMGFARIEGSPENFHGVNINGGKNAEHLATFPRKGKTAGLVFDDGALFASINLQDGPWPDVNHVLAWSTDLGATWTRADWLFPKGAGQFQPATFLKHDRFIYVCGPRQNVTTNLYLARVPAGRLRERAAYEFSRGPETWSSDATQAQPIFNDARGVSSGTLTYAAALKRFLLTVFHTGPGQLGVFDAPTPWGPWTTVAYYEDWSRMGAEGDGLTCSFPAKWMSADGLTLWSVFSVYGPGAKQGIRAHDQFNLLKATLTLRQKVQP